MVWVVRVVRMVRVMAMRRVAMIIVRRVTVTIVLQKSTAQLLVASLRLMLVAFRREVLVVEFAAALWRRRRWTRQRAARGIGAPTQPSSRLNCCTDKTTVGAAAAGLSRITEAS